MKKPSFRSALGAWVLFLAGLALAGACTAGPGESTGGETHFLRHCAAPTDSCGPELTCLDGVCTALCDEDTACDAFVAAQCLPVGMPSGAANESPKRCDVPCNAHSDCAVLSAEHRCEAEVCRAPAQSPSAGFGGATSSADLGAAGASDCPLDGLRGNQVLVVGDSFFASTHQVTGYMEDLARSASRLPTGERYRDASRLLENALALGGNGIAAQYTAAAQEAEARVVVMNGGGADVLLGTCETVDQSCPLLSAAAGAARDLLSTMADDGVSLVVYAFYPDADEAIREKMDVLRPLIESSCANAEVPCRWVDLRPVFAEHSADYIQADGLNPTDAGAQATARAIWAAMGASCAAPAP